MPNVNLRDGPEEKTCPICAISFPRKGSISNEHWRQQKTCSRHCAVVYRKSKPGAVQSRQNSKAAMNQHWQIQRAKAAAKASVPIRAPREDEEAAIARFVAERGVTRAPAVEAGDLESGRVVQQPARSAPMPGWR